MSQAVKRACDACHRRKVKCDGINPCRNCSSAQLSCTYNAIPQKKGPKGSRAKVISELRETQRQTSLLARVQNRVNGIAPQPAPAVTTSAGLLTSDLVKECLAFFFAHTYPLAPVVDRRQLEQYMLFMEQNSEAYCLLASLCAFAMLQPGMVIPGNEVFNLPVAPGANITACNILLEETLRVRRSLEYLDVPSMNSMTTSYFLFACYHNLEYVDKAWYYLRETATMMHMAAMNKDETYLQWDAAEACRRKRLFWLVHATERAYGVRRQRPLSLESSIEPPSVADDPSDPQAQHLAEFLYTVNALRPLAISDMKVWNSTRESLKPAFISRLQKQFNDVWGSCEDPELSDISLNEQWLASMVWEMRSSNYMITHARDGTALSSPVKASETSATMAAQFPVEDFAMFGDGLLKRMLDMVPGVLRAMELKPASRDPFTMGPREHMGQILKLVGALRRGDLRFMPLLLLKLDDAMWRLICPLLINAPESAPMMNEDIFDGFGNAGMAQPVPQMHMGAAEADFSQAFSMSEYDMHSASSHVPSTSGAMQAAMTSSFSPNSASESTPPGSFGSSPPLVSPGLDYQHALDYNCTPMHDVIMTPGTQAQQLQMHSGLPILQQQPPPPPPQQQHMITPSPEQEHMRRKVQEARLQLQMQEQLEQLQQQQQQQRQQQHRQQQQQQLQMQHMQPSLIGGHSQTLDSHPPSSHHPMHMDPTGHMMGALPPQQQQHAHSFGVSRGQPIPRTVGDFHALQRASSDLASPNSMVGMDMKPEMDFSLLR